MDAQQTQEWSDYACMSEALIKAAASKNIPLTPDEYRAKYEHLFPCRQTHYGGLILSRFYFIARDIGLGQDMDLYHDYSKINEKVNKEGRLAFILSAIDLRAGFSGSINHTSLLLSIDDYSFAVDGYPALTPADWITKRCCAILMF